MEENQENIKTEEKKKSSRNWLMWWDVKEEEVERQIEGYNTLSIFKSARGQSALFLILSALITFIFIVTGVVEEIGKTAYIDIALLLVLAFFIYRGQRWAMIGAMGLWTLEKILAVMGGLGSWALQILWWMLFMSAFWLAYKVETERKRRKEETTP